VHVRSPQLVLRLGLDAEQTFYDDVVHFGPHVPAIHAQLLQVLAKGGQGPLEAAVTLLSIIVLHESLVLFIDGVVGQVGEFGLLTRQVLILVLLRCEANESLSVDVNAQGVIACDHDVNAQVELVALNK